MTIEIRGLTPLIQVFDMIQSAQFYREVLGFEVVNASPEVETPEGQFSHWMWLRLESVELMLNTAYNSGERPPSRDTARELGHADVSLYIGCTDVDAVYETLTGRGMVADPPVVTRHGIKQFIVRDPDGYQLCFNSPADRT